MKRQFIAYFWFVGFDCISLGMSMCLDQPNIEIHLPFGFIRIGWSKINPGDSMNYDDISWRGFGLMERKCIKN